MAIQRTSITVPADLLRAADRRARELDRPRSWVVAEALRRYLAEPAVSEPVAAYTAGLGPQRLAQLESDLALTPEQRVREAGRTAAEAALVRQRPAQNRIITFDRFEDYLDWKRVDDT